MSRRAVHRPHGRHVCPATAASSCPIFLSDNFWHADVSEVPVSSSSATLRLKANVNISGLPPQARVIAQALKTYGAVVADNGSAWYISGTQDSRWNNDQLNALKTLTGSDFEVVNDSSEEISPNSGRAG